MPPISTRMKSPALTGSRGTSEPERITSPAFSGMPKRPRVLASQATQLTGEPRAAAPAPVLQLAVLLHQHAAGDQVDLAWRHCRVAEHEQAAGGVVRYCVLDIDFPVADARIDDLETGHHALGGGQHVGVGH